MIKTLFFSQGRRIDTSQTAPKCFLFSLQWAKHANLNGAFTGSDNENFLNVSSLVITLHPVHVMAYRQAARDA